MSVSIDIHPLSGTLDMYGEPDTSSAYSLSGHVTISVASPYSLFERRRTARLLLHSVALTFEGRSELITPQMGYTSVRLYSVTRELAPEEPMELNNDGHEESGDACHWNMVFNIPIPGWLPATSTFGFEEEVGNTYTMYATAKFINLDDNRSTFSALCSPFRSRMRSVNTEKNIPLRRFANPPAPSPSTPSDFPPVTYLVTSPASASKRPSDASPIPPEILSKIQVLASVPEHVNVDSDSLPFTLRLRTKDLDEEACKRLQVTAFKVNLTQVEKARYRPSPEYLSRYPLPPMSSQPPNQPLRSPHPISLIYDVGLYISPTLAESTISRSFSLLPPAESGEYTIAGDNYVFANDAVPVEAPTWYTMETKLSFVHCGRASECANWSASPRIRPTAVSPLFGVSHQLSISLTCSYDLPGSEEKATGVLNFAIPVCFAEMAPALPRSQSPPPSHSATATGSAITAPLIDATLAPTIPYTQPLPAYSQLFDSNGDRKIDYSVPLPLYTPRSPGSSSTLTLELDAVTHERKELQQ